MMLPFFLLILLGLPWVDTTVNNKTGMDNSTLGLANAIEPRHRWVPQQRCERCSVSNTFSCSNKVVECSMEIRRCLTIAVRENLRSLFVYKDCTKECPFVYKELLPPPLPKLIKTNNGFYFVLCCGSVVCNEGGPNNVERDLIPDMAIEEEVISRAVRLGWFSFLLCLALILSSSMT